MHLLSNLDKFPFLTLAKYVDQEYLGIICNSDNQITSMYVFNVLPDDAHKKLFLSLGDEWWWETNRQIPINVALKDRWQPFRGCLRTFSSKDFVVLEGPRLSLDNVMNKRIKRRHIALVKKI